MATSICKIIKLLLDEKQDPHANLNTEDLSIEETCGYKN